MELASWNPAELLGIKWSRGATCQGASEDLEVDRTESIAVPHASKQPDLLDVDAQLLPKLSSNAADPRLSWEALASRELPVAPEITMRVTATDEEAIPSLNNADGDVEDGDVWEHHKESCDSDDATHTWDTEERAPYIPARRNPSSLG